MNSIFLITIYNQINLIHLITECFIKVATDNFLEVSSLFDHKTISRLRPEGTDYIKLLNLFLKSVIWETNTILQC